MIRHESEFSLGVNRASTENPEVSPIFEDFSSSEKGEEQPLPQQETPIFQETPFKPELSPQTETQTIEEEQLEQPQRETLNWLQRKIEEGKEKGELLIKRAEEKGIVLTERDRKKLLFAPILWPVHGYISTYVGLPALATAVFLWRAGNHLSSLRYLMAPGVLQLVSIFFYEKTFGVKFSWLSKGVALWPFVGGGSAVPVEIAYTLRDARFLLDEIKEGFKTPLTRVRGAFQKFRKHF